MWVTSLALALHHIGGRFGLGRSSISFAPCGESEQGRTLVHPSLVDSFSVVQYLLTLNLKLEELAEHLLEYKTILRYTVIAYIVSVTIGIGYRLWYLGIWAVSYTHLTLPTNREV